MKTLSPAMTLIAKYRKRLVQLDVGDALTIHKDGLITLADLRQWYRAARSQNIRVTIKHTPEGTRLWRVS